MINIIRLYHDVSMVARIRDENSAMRSTVMPSEMGEIDIRHEVTSVRKILWVINRVIGSL